MRSQKPVSLVLRCQVKRCDTVVICTPLWFGSLVQRYSKGTVQSLVVPELLFTLSQFVTNTKSQVGQVAMRTHSGKIRNIEEIFKAPFVFYMIFIALMSMTMYSQVPKLLNPPKLSSSTKTCLPTIPKLTIYTTYSWLPGCNVPSPIPTEYFSFFTAYFCLGFVPSEQPLRLLSCDSTREAYFLTGTSFQLFVY